MVSLVHTAALALTAVSGAMATATCGDLQWACCDIPENDPNGGTCKDDTRMACWEGFCKPCGTDGMPACAGDTPCVGKNIIHVGTFCTFDNSKVPAPAPKSMPAPAPKATPAPTKPPRKRPSKAKGPKGPRKGRRVRSKGPKAPRGSVKPPPAPKAAPAPIKAKKPDPAPLVCGDLQWECCDIPDNDPNGGTCKDDTRMACWEGFCKPCGTDGMPVCAGSTPCTGKLVIHHGFCTFDNGSY